MLDAYNLCALFLDPARPRVCLSFQPTEDACGADGGEAMAILSAWEALTGGVAK